MAELRELVLVIEREEYGEGRAAFLEENEPAKP